MGVAGDDPGQSGDDPAAYPFEDGPEGREDEEDGDGVCRVPSFHEKTGQACGKTGQYAQKEREQDDGGHGHGGIHATVLVHADEKPVDA